MEGFFSFGPIEVLCSKGKVARLKYPRATNRARALASLAYPETAKALFPEDKEMWIPRLATGFLALKTVIIYGNLGGIKHLESLGFDINVKDNYKRNLSVIAGENGHLEVLKYLARKGVDIKDSGNLPVISAAAHGHLKSAKFLSSLGADVTDLNNFILDNVRLDSLNLLSYLAKEGANFRSDNGASAFGSACNDGYYQAVKFMLYYGADGNNSYALKRAKHNRYGNIIALLRLPTKERLEKAYNLVRAFSAKELMARI